MLTGNTWVRHGAEVRAATPYLPGSFDRTPRNPAEKISSGYKAWEFLTYIYSLAPGLLYDILPHAHWRNFCQLVRGVRLIHQRSISTQEVVEAHGHLLGFVTGFEDLYYQRKQERLHFCRQSIHALLHSAPEVEGLGPGVCSSQWPMERVLGDLEEEMHQDSDPYANLAQVGLTRCQNNTLIAMAPSLPRSSKNRQPKSAICLGNGYTLLGPKDRSACKIPSIEAAAIKHYFHLLGFQFGNSNPRVQKWGRLQLPNEQFVRTLWKEGPKDKKKIRSARNISVSKILSKKSIVY